ncbi:S-layer family protein [Aulosira sp. FACHB-615]|uniref:two-partner secretion domain-containing protein n=1 Tax=Aulosira sp. FACHB-615 TaxID=2692777 RepID=UPI001681D23B|nr:S-layer family protein [Aulosira sp. FACHB-615]MBD2489073.1 S-layer family protein [Aulosira sp. FACHB-615]
MKVNFAGFGLLSVICISVVYNNSVHAQVTPDGTLNTDVNSYSITKGTRIGNNLFHSFSQFSIPTGVSVSFGNDPTVENIFSRVTGGQVSHIDGRISANGNANLFLLNPAGIIFGKNASLRIGGSFVGTTANGIKFDDGNVFSTDITQSPLLTMKVPIGLQLGSDAGSVQVQGTLQVPTGKTLALVGSQIDMTQATLRAADGRVELWAVRNADIKMDNQTGWQLGSSAAAADWGTITLQQGSLINVNGTNGGAIQIQGRGLTVKENSNITSVTQSGVGKDIVVKTTEFINLLGASSPRPIFNPGIGTSVGAVFGPPATGRAGDVLIETGKLYMNNGAWLQSTTFGSNSRTGNLTIRASDVEVIGANPLPNAAGIFVPTDITTLIMAGTNNQGGDIIIETNRLRTVDGGLISGSIFNLRQTLGLNNLIATGNGGNVSIRANESFEISGGTPSGLRSGVTTALQPSGGGQAGDITITAGRLQLSNGGIISSAAAGNGTSGDINIQATEVIVSEPVLDQLSQLASGITVSVGKNVIGTGGTINLTADRLQVSKGGQITASTQGRGNAGNINLQVKEIDVQGISPTTVNGNYLYSAIAASSTTNSAAGSINIKSDTVNVRNDGEITVSNIGNGDAGNLNISANRIFLKNGASLRSEVNEGDQGNIQLQANEVLLLRQGSNITTNARGLSTGGNININAGLIVTVPKENSDISANAVLGSGGNIQITTGGILGLKFSDQLTLDSDITASSQFGVNGTVEVSSIGVDPNSGLVKLPGNVTDQSQLIASSCNNTNGSSFVATGRGGIPQNPTQELRSDRTWSDVRDISAFHTTKPAQAQIPKSSEVLVEATGWRRNALGKIELFAYQSPSQVQVGLTCAAVAEN